MQDTLLERGRGKDFHKYFSFDLSANFKNKNFEVHFKPCSCLQSFKMAGWCEDTLWCIPLSASLAGTIAESFVAPAAHGATFSFNV